MVAPLSITDKKATSILVVVLQPKTILDEETIGQLFIGENGRDALHQLIMDFLAYCKTKREHP